MMVPEKNLHRSRQEFHFGRRLLDLFVGRVLARRAEQHLAAGLPPVATFAFDFIGRNIAITGRFEYEELAVVEDFLLPLRGRFATATALDIGANIGNHSLFFSPWFKTIHSFEPNPGTFGVLTVNAALAKNIIVHNVALGSEDGKLALAFDPRNIGEASLVGHGKAGAKACEVVVRRLDDLAHDMGPIALIKIDVEGFEPEVLAGAEQTLRDQRPIIIIEQNRQAFVDGRSPAISMLQALNYRFCAIRKRNSGGRGIAGLIGTLQKIWGGVTFDVIRLDDVPPDDYPMIIAVSDSDLPLLSRGT